MINLIPEKRNKDSEFEEIYKAYSKSIFNFCMTRLNYNDDCSSDCTQQIFTIYYEKITEGIIIENPRAYLYRIAENIIKKKYYQIKRERDNIENVDESEIVNIKSVDNNEDSIIGKIAYDELIKIIKDSLTDYEFRLFELKYIEGFKVYEIAKMENLTECNCSVKLYRIRKKLIERIKEYSRREEMQ